MMVSFDHFNALLKGGISRVASYIVLEEIFTTPSTLQYGSDIKKDIVRRNDLGINHFVLFCSLNIFLHFQHLFLHKQPESFSFALCHARSLLRHRNLPTFSPIHFPLKTSLL